MFARCTQTPVGFHVPAIIDLIIVADGGNARQTDMHSSTGATIRQGASSRLQTWMAMGGASAILRYSDSQMAIDVRERAQVKSLKQALTVTGQSMNETYKLNTIGP